VPDEVRRFVPSGPGPRSDLLDDLPEFVARLPKWVGEDGFPLSFSHYVYGMNYLNRAKAADQLESASAFRAAQSNRKDYEGWRRDLMRILNHG